MENKDISDNPEAKKDEPLISDILKTLFKYQDIEFESVALIHWKIVEDDIVPQLVYTLGDITALCGDGSYHIAIKNASISGIEEEPIETPEINVEVSLNNGQWSEPRIYTDFETCSPQSATPEALTTRLEKIKHNITGTLQLISLILKIAESVRDLFS